MEQKETLASRLARAMEMVGAVGKDGRNDFHRYDYTSAAAVLGKVQQALSKCGLVILGTAPELVGDEQIPDRKGNPQRYIRVRLTLTVGDVDGTGTVSWVGYGEGIDAADKAYAKAETTALKYLLRTALLIPFGEDVEADTKTDEAFHGKGKSADLAGAIKAGQAEDKEAAEVRAVIQWAREASNAQHLQEIVQGTPNDRFSATAKRTLWAAYKRAGERLGVDEATVKGWVTG